jgi:hypothetical protein
MNIKIETKKIDYAPKLKFIDGFSESYESKIAKIVLLFILAGCILALLGHLSKSEINHCLVTSTIKSICH